jgi:undecaprenyl diphosphate synthase
MNEHMDEPKVRNPIAIDPYEQNGVDLPAERLAEVRRRSLPHHIAIIMDGNGRWARRRGQPRTFGHRKGLITAERIVRFVADDLGIQYLTLYAFSKENWGRPPGEVDFLLRLIGEFIREKRNLLLENGIRLRVLGDLEELPPQIRTEVERTVELTAPNERFHLSIAFNYGGRQEILRAVRQIVDDRLNGRLNGEPIDETLFSRYLYTSGLPDPDMLIRTGGEERVSNFLLWQIAYAELWVTETLWPDFTPEELLDAIEEYQCRERRFGRVVHP